MNKKLRTIIIAVVVVLGAFALVGTGLHFGLSTAWGMTGNSYPGNIMGYDNQIDHDFQCGYGMMNESGYCGMEPGMISGTCGYGMMNGFGDHDNVVPLTVEETREAVESYLASFGNDDLAIEEIMIFDNNAYAIVVEESTGMGAFELLVDPVTKAVFPEYGPNMMWNLKYGMMSGFDGYGIMGPGMMMGSSGYGHGSMMGGIGKEIDIPDVSSESSVSPEEALDAAQRFLDQYSPGVKVSDEITPFYGYYTIDTEQDGEIIGMLSVNGFTGQVFPHTWHGDFLEMVETGHE